MSERQIPEFAKELNRAEQAKEFHGHYVEYKELPRAMYLQFMNLYFTLPFGPRYEEVKIDVKKSFDELKKAELFVLRDHVEIIVARCTSCLKQDKPPANVSPDMVTTMVYMFNFFIACQREASPDQQFRKFEAWPFLSEEMETE